MLRPVWRRYLIALLTLTIAACATTPSAPPTVDVTGVWRGTWAGRGRAGSGNFNLTLAQKGSEVTGTIETTGTARGINGPIVQGSVSKNVYHLVTTTGQVSGDLTVNGDSMSGTVDFLISADVQLSRQR